MVYRDRVGVTHWIRGNFGFGVEAVEVVKVAEVVVVVEVVEVVAVGEVVVLGSSSWRILVFRASGSSGFTMVGDHGIGELGGSGRGRSCRIRLPVGELVGAQYRCNGQNPIFKLI